MVYDSSAVNELTPLLAVQAVIILACLCYLINRNDCGFAYVVFRVLCFFKCYSGNISVDYDD